MAQTPEEKLKIVLPHLLLALAEAKKEGHPIFTIAAKHKDGGGKLLLELNEAEEFLQDLAKVVGVELVPTQEQERDFKAFKFLSKFGFNK